MARLRTARLTNDSLVSSIDDAIAALELDLCDIFGYVEDSNITESAFSLDNSGRIAKALIRSVYPVSPSETDSDYVGYQIIVGPPETQFAYVVLNRVFAGTYRMVMGGAPDHENATTPFSIVMTDGELHGYTFSTASQGLVPQSSGSANEFLHASGIWLAPGLTPNHARATEAALSTGLATVLHNTLTDIHWFGESYDSGTIHDVSANRNLVTAPATGKYTIGATFGLLNPVAMDGSGYMQLSLYLNGATIIAQSVQKLLRDELEITVGDVATDYALTAGDTVELKVLHTAVTKGGSNADLTIFESLFGAFSLSLDQVA